MEFVELSDKEFAKFEQKCSCGNFFQSVERKKLRNHMNWQTHLLGVKESGKVVAGAFLMCREGNALVQLGPILNYDNTKLLDFWVKNVVKFCREQNFISLEVFPPFVISNRDGKGEKTFEADDAKIQRIFEKHGFSYDGRTVKLENKANRWMAVKDLSELKDMTAVRATYKKNVRNKLRKISPELEIYEVKDKTGLVDFAKVVDESNSKNDVVSRNFVYYEDMWDAWGDKLRVVLARRKEDGVVVAGRMLIYHPNEVVSFISGTAQAYKKYNGMTFLQDWLLQDCLEKGIHRVNFYGIDGDFSSENKLLEFKNGFGVKIEEYVGGFLVILDGDAYAKQLRKKKVLGALRKIKHDSRSLINKIKKRQTKVVRKVKIEDK